MTIITGAPPLSVGARRRALCELADLVNAEKTATDQPLTDALLTLIPALCATHVAADVRNARRVFDCFAEQRDICMSPTAPYEAMDAAERAAELLLDTLVGERPLAVAS